MPLQRLGEEREHAWLIGLLASPVGHAFNGSVVTLDGARDNWFGPWPPPSLADESGEDLIEYGLLAAFVAAVALATIILDPLGITTSLKNAYQKAKDALDKGNA